MRENDRETARQPRVKPEGIYKSRGLHNAFNKDGIHALCEKDVIRHKKKSCIRKIMLILNEYFQKCTFSKPFNTKTNLCPKFLTWDRHTKHVVVFNL